MYVLAPNQTVEKLDYSIGQLRKDNPQVSFPKHPSIEVLADFNVFPVTEVAPAYNPETQLATQSGCEYNATLSRWETSWTIRDLTEQEIAENTAAKNAALFREVQDKTQARLDTFAQTRNYSGVLSLCTYAASANPKFQQEGQYGVEARDTTWAKLYEILAEVEAGTRPVPSGYADVESELPTLTWPA